MSDTNSTDRQLEQWVRGHSVHDTDIDQCCPDFSCCNKKMITPLKTRERFAKAAFDNDEKTKIEMLGMFLGKACDTLDKKVYIAGLDPQDSET